MAAPQAEVIDFLGSAGAHGSGVSQVDRIETHGAVVFLAGPDVYKIKRCVRFSYMDFSTLELRRRACARELEINRPHAPQIYLGLLAITREADGRLAIGGAGTPVEWAVHMRRFDQSSLLSARAERCGLDGRLARDIADAVHAYHCDAQVARDHGALAQLAAVVDEVGGALTAIAGAFRTEDITRLADACRCRLVALEPVLDRRAMSGFVRRCHGDLHLANIVLWDGRPTLFDAIEFDEAMATVDTLYDLAFLLMDLDQRGQRAAANAVLNRYLWRSQEMLDLDGLAAMPLFLALRAAIRAMVEAQRASQQAEATTRPELTRPRAYLQAALGYLAPAAPRLVGVGGLSGTGKSTLAAALSPLIGPAPGAVHLRSDLERKAMLGVGETERLPQSCYTPETSRRVYEVLTVKARAALAAGHAVVVDAVYLTAAERADLERIARELGVPFTGLWLTAPEATMLARVGARVGDASDATTEVVRQQIAWLGAAAESAWTMVDAGGTPQETMRHAATVLALPLAP